MQIYKLTPRFYTENTHLKEVLDKTNGSWDTSKIRGYGIIIADYNSLRFGIPLRSKIDSNNGFHTVDGKGLDYRKAVLLKEDEYISNDPFEIDKKEHEKIRSKARTILKEFNNYIKNYRRGILRNDHNILKHYDYTTLINYHLELDLIIAQGCGETPNNLSEE